MPPTDEEPPKVISAGTLGTFDMPSHSPSSDSSTGMEVKFSGSGGSKIFSTDEDEEDAEDGPSTDPTNSRNSTTTQQRITRSASAHLNPGLRYDKPSNQALVFVKPHVMTDAVCDLVESTLLESIPSSKILVRYTVSGARIGRKRLIDRHYKTIARYGTEMEVGALDFKVDKFEKVFKEKWSKVLAENQACNAVQALSKLGCDPKRLEEAWRKAESAQRTTKLAPGMYIGLVGINDKSMYVVNGFYMAMRGKFVGEDCKVKCMVVEWDERNFSWEAFRSKVIGATDPTKAVEGSLRRIIMERYKELGLETEPTTGDNAVHASASPLEGLAERCNWLSHSVAEDDFGRALLGRGVTEDKILEWMDDPTITFPPSTADGSRKSGSLFDDVEDTDSSRCMQRLVEIYDDELFSNGNGCKCVIL